MDSIDDFETFEEIELTYSSASSPGVLSPGVLSPGVLSPGVPSPGVHSQEKSRLDQFITNSIAELSRSNVRKLIDDQLVLVNGKAEKASYRLREGDRVTIRIPPAVPLDVVAEDIPLNVVFEDDHLIVVDKPSGMVTHPGAGVSSRTLVNALLHHCRGSLSGISGVERPGIVHRLDKDTSGLIVAAKDDFTHKKLAADLHERKVKRTYIALVEGSLKVNEGTVDQPLARHPVKRKQMAIVAGGRRAVTHFKVLKRYAKFTLLECRLETGRTHQIRVHMAYLDCPVVGDLVYNRKSTGSEKARVKLGLKGHALHAARLSFTHPKTGQEVSLESPLPADFANLIAIEN